MKSEAPDWADSLMGRLLPGRLDHRHPLWELVLVDGLDDGGQAVVFRYHHALADGGALVTALGGLCHPAGEELTMDVPPTGSPTELGSAQSVRRALRDQARNLVAVPALVRDTRDRFRAVQQRRESSVVAVPASNGAAPRTVLNRAPGVDRSFGRLVMSVDDLVRVKDRAGTTVNDVVLAVVGGGLRRYLRARGELPARALLANVPVADPPPAGGTPYGNHFANLVTSLCTHTSDPWEQLVLIGQGTSEAKAQLELLGRDTLRRWLDLVPPAIARPAARSMARRAGRSVTADFNVVVSSVRVPGDGWAIGGNPIEAVSIAGPLTGGVGLNVTATSYGGRVLLALVADPAAIPNVADLTAAMAAELSALVVCAR